MSLKTYLGGGLAALALVAPAAASAASPYQKGPEPTQASVRASAGTYEVNRRSIGDGSTPGFGAATLWYPTAAAGETFGAVSIVPGFTESEKAISWLGPRLASQGFVVVTFNTNNIFELPKDRASELIAALNWAKSTSVAKDIIDPNRLAFVGHSMGGGGVLEAAQRKPAGLKATVGLTPWDQQSNWSTVTAPSLIIAAENDIIAPKIQHALPFYAGLPSTTPKLYAELNDGDHFSPTKTNISVSALTLSWLKLFVDDDTRYKQFLCPYPYAAPAGKLNGAKSNCPVYPAVN